MAGFMVVNSLFLPLFGPVPGACLGRGGGGGLGSNPTSGHRAATQTLGTSAAKLSLISAPTNSNVIAEGLGRGCRYLRLLQE